LAQNPNLMLGTVLLSPITIGLAVIRSALLVIASAVWTAGLWCDEHSMKRPQYRPLSDLWAEALTDLS